MNAQVQVAGYQQKFISLSFQRYDTFPVIYCANKKGWITTELSLDWFHNCFVLKAGAHCNSVGLESNCKIMLLLDSCSAHPKTELLVKDNVFCVYFHLTVLY